MPLFLYYAGMARDTGATEQIGLARSDDGICFERAHGDGLIVPVDPSIEWKSLRTCNPTVLAVDGRYVMFYQGIAKQPPHHISIGCARSDDGIAFHCATNPSLTFEHLRDFSPKLNPDERLGVCEPSVIRENGRFGMWFVHVSRDASGNDLYYAESADGDTWTVAGRVLSGHQFGDFNLHYPQVMRMADGYELWFTLRDNRSYVYGTFRMTSPDGRQWGHLCQLLPRAVNGIQLSREFLLDVSIAAKTMRAPHVLDAVYGRLFTRRNHSGLAHPHVMNGVDDRVVYLHAYHCDRGSTLWMDIARGTLRGNSVGGIQTVFRRSADPGAWDSFFVADPFVLTVPDVVGCGQTAGPE